MRVAVDGRSLLAGRGVGRYARSLLPAMAAARPGAELRVLVPGRGELEAPVPVVRHRLGGRALFGAAALLRRPRLERLVGGADVVWAPAPAPLAVGRGVPLVVTFHDLSWVRRPRDFTAYERFWHAAGRLRALAERATALVAVSEATRDDLVALWDVPPSRIVVVPSGPGLGAGEAAPPPEGAPYLLVVGALEPRKAPELVARAWARARAHGLRAELVFAGEGRLAGAGARPGVRLLGAVGDARLRGLYAGALAVVQAAWLEGFAFPPAEGLLQGTPAIVADLPVYRETVGGGALRVAPGDEAALARAMLELERDPALRARLAAEGARAVTRLSWERAARETLAVLERAASP